MKCQTISEGTVIWVGMAPEAHLSRRVCRGLNYTPSDLSVGPLFMKLPALTSSMEKERGEIDIAV